MKKWLPKVGDLLYWDDNTVTKVVAVEPENGFVKAHFTGLHSSDSNYAYEFDIKAMRKYARIVKPNPNPLRKEIARLKVALKRCVEHARPKQRGDY